MKDNNKKSCAPESIVKNNRIVNIVVTYNRDATLAKTLNILLENEFTDVILVDNASTDKTDKVASSFKEKFPNFSYIKLRDNTGGSGGFRAGLTLFIQKYSDGDFCIIHDDDSWPDFKLSDLLRFVDGKIEMGAFPVFHPDGDLVAMNRPGVLDIILKPLSLKSYLKKRRPKNISDFESFENFHYSSFVGLLMSFGAVSRIGVPSEKFFIYSDDTYYTSYATQRFGYSIQNLFSSSMYFMHDCNRSTGISLLSSRFIGYEIRNKIIFLREFSKFWRLHSFFFITKSLVLMPRRASAILKSAYDGLTADLREYKPSIPIR